MSDALPPTDNQTYNRLRQAGRFEDRELAGISIPGDILSIVPIETAVQYRILPVALDDGNLVLVTTPESNNLLSRSHFEQLFGRPVRFKFSAETNIINAISAHYAVSAETLQRKEAQLSHLSMRFQIERSQEEKIDQRNEVTTALTQLVEDIIYEALKRNASDIHIEPIRKNELSWVLFRIDGELKDFTDTFNICKYERHSAVVNRFKVICEPSMETTVKNMPLDGSFKIPWKGKKIECRVSTTPTIVDEEKLVVRLHDSATDLQELETLGFDEEDYKTITKLGRLPSGLVIVSGPTGSGKTTTLFAVLRRYDPKEDNVITIEDPPEIRIEGFTQIALKKAEDEKNSLTYGKVLRSILRQDPDVILVGETRDPETAEVTIEASLTGHVVFTTLHTKDCISTIDRMFSLRVDKVILLNELTCIISQRLLPILCSKCSEPYQLTKEDGYLLSTDELLQLSNGTLKQPNKKGCPECDYSGYTGRTVVAEVLYFDNKLRSFLKDDVKPDEILEYLRDNYGFIGMWEKGFKMVRHGKVYFGNLVSIIRENQ